MELRRTKIIATLGPSTSGYKALKDVIAAGVDVVRLNMSHGSHEEHRQKAELAREIAAKLDKEVGVLVDLQGPKVRIARFAAGGVLLKKGQEFTIDPDVHTEHGDESKVGLDYYQLADDLSAKDILLLDDGRIILEVEKINGQKIFTKVLVGGELSNNKGINKQGGGISADALTAKDKKDLAFAKEINADYIAISFVKTASDVEDAKELLGTDNNIGVIAKIECKDALDNITDIINSSDAIMVARGDLGVEIGVAEVPAVQKELITLARSSHKAVITATQMMESMISATIPTRAEVSDVANAVLDGTDAVMLSAETASGDNPLQVVKTMSEVCLAAERQKSHKKLEHKISHSFRQVDEAIAMSAMYAANNFAIQAIVSLTETGTTALLMSRIHSGIPIYGISRNATSRGKMSLYRGVYPIEFDVTKFERWQVIREVLTNLTKQGILKSGQRVIITRGDIIGVSGRSNAMKIVTVE